MSAFTDLTLAIAGLASAINTLNTTVTGLPPVGSSPTDAQLAEQQQIVATLQATIETLNTKLTPAPIVPASPATPGGLTVPSPVITDRPA